MNLYALCASASTADLTQYVVDIVVALFILVFVIVCTKKGFITCFFGFISTIVALAAAVMLAKAAVEMTGGLFGLQGYFETTFTESFSNLNGFNVPIDQDADLAELLATQDMSAILANLIAQNWVDVAIPEGSTLGMLAGQTVAQYATVLISGIALFLIIKIVFAILKKMFNFAAKKISLIGALNRLLGAAVGLVEAVLILSLVVAILAMFPSMMAFLNGSVILSTLYNSNPLMWLISLFL